MGYKGSSILDCDYGAPTSPWEELRDTFLAFGGTILALLYMVALTVPEAVQFEINGWTKPMKKVPVENVARNFKNACMYMLCMPWYILSRDWPKREKRS